MHTLLAFSNDFLHVFSHLGGSTELPVELYRALSVGAVQHARGSTAARRARSIRGSHHRRAAAARRCRRRSMPPTLSEDTVASLALARALAHSGALRAGEGVAAEHGGGRRARAPARRRAPSCLCIYRKNSSPKEFVRMRRSESPISREQGRRAAREEALEAHPGPFVYCDGLGPRRPSFVNTCEA